VARPPQVGGDLQNMTASNIGRPVYAELAMLRIASFVPIIRNVQQNGFMNVHENIWQL